jgi:hypothetical protein
VRRSFTLGSRINIILNMIYYFNVECNKIGSKGAAYLSRLSKLKNTLIVILCYTTDINLDTYYNNLV